MAEGRVSRLDAVCVMNAAGSSGGIAGFLPAEQVFDGEYLKTGECPERRIEHNSTGGLFFHRGRGLGKRDEQAHG